MREKEQQLYKFSESLIISRTRKWVIIKQMPLKNNVSHSWKEKRNSHQAMRTYCAETHILWSPSHDQTKQQWIGASVYCNRVLKNGTLWKQCLLDKWNTYDLLKMGYIFQLRKLTERQKLESVVSCPSKVRLERESSKLRTPSVSHSNNFLSTTRSIMGDSINFSFPVQGRLLESPCHQMFITLFHQQRSCCSCSTMFYLAKLSFPCLDLFFLTSCKT